LSLTVTFKENFIEKLCLKNTVNIWNRTDSKLLLVLELVTNCQNTIHVSTENVLILFELKQITFPPKEFPVNMNLKQQFEINKIPKELEYKWILCLTSLGIRLRSLIWLSGHNQITGPKPTGWYTEFMHDMDQTEKNTSKIKTQDRSLISSISVQFFSYTAYD
jgi:hypothetical protein